MKALLTTLLFFVCLTQHQRAAHAGELRAENCVITALHLTDGGLQLSFTGRWIVSEHSALVLADTDKNGFFVIRDQHANPAAWKSLCETARRAFDQRSAVTITASNWGATRGGVIIFKTPPDQLKISFVNPP